MKKLLFLILLLFQSAYAADVVLSELEEDQIESAFNIDGMATVVVGLSDLNTAKTLNSSIIISSKAQFLRSTPVVKSLASRSMQVIDELEYLPYVVMQVDARGLKALQTHPQVISIEADYSHKPYLMYAVPRLFGVANPWERSIFNGAGRGLRSLTRV